MAGYGYHAAAVAGFFELTGWPDRDPVGPWNAYTDTVAPRFLTATLLAALDHKRRTGEGQHIDLAQLEAALHFLAPEMIARQTTDIAFRRSGNRSLDAAPQGVYPCAGDDEWCAIAVEDDAQWKALRAVLGDPEWARDAQARSMSRVDSRPTIGSTKRSAPGRAPRHRARSCNDSPAAACRPDTCSAAATSSATPSTAIAASIASSTTPRWAESRTADMLFA